MSRTRLTNRERFDIESFIAQHGDETELGWEYHDGWSDIAVGKQCNTTHKTVANIRHKTFGNLAGHASRSSTKMMKILERLDAIEQRLAALDEKPALQQQNWLQRSGNGISATERTNSDAT